MPGWLDSLLSMFGLSRGTASAATDSGAAQRASDVKTDPAPASGAPPEWFSLMDGVDDNPATIPSADYDGSHTLADHGWQGLKAKAQAFYKQVETACGQQGVQFGLDEGYRPRRRQAYLYAQGRILQDGTWVVTDKKAIVTNAKPGKSVHQSGMAFDLHIVESVDPATGKKHTSYDETKMGKIAVVVKGMGGKWGGDFKLASGQPDTDHFEVV